MKLLWSSRSPFARKVTIAAHELGIADSIETVRVVVNVSAPNPHVMRLNPVGKIPALILNDGTVLQDSAVILEYLNTRHGGSLLPAEGPDRWKTLVLQSLADGIMEADLRWLEERRLPPAERREAIVSAMRKKIEAALDRIEAEPPNGVTVGAIATASALAHLDFRFPDAPWRLERSRLQAWFEAFAVRPSMIATEFVDAC